MTSQDALDDRERKEIESEVLRPTLTATDQAFWLMTQINKTIALANNHSFKRYFSFQ